MERTTDVRADDPETKAITYIDEFETTQSCMGRLTQHPLISESVFNVKLLSVETKNLETECLEALRIARIALFMDLEIMNQLVRIVYQ